MAQDLTNELSTLTLIEPRNIAVGSGTVTQAGIDVRDYVGKIKVIATLHSAHNLASNSVVFDVLDSADNTTFAAVSHATPLTTTASTYTGGISVDTRQTARYLQGRVRVTGTTQTAECAMVGVALDGYL